MSVDFYSFQYFLVPFLLQYHCDIGFNILIDEEILEAFSALKFTCKIDTLQIGVELIKPLVVLTFVFHLV